VPEDNAEKAIELGRPGASARAEFERRRTRDAQRRRKTFGRYLAPVIRVLTAERPTTAVWDRGGRQEERVGEYLTDAIGPAGIVLHDRKIRGTRSNIDHIAVVPSGVWVIDTKQYKGRVSQRTTGGWLVARPALFVNGHNRTSLIPAVRRQAVLVQEVVGKRIPVHAVLCFADANWGPLGAPFSLGGVTVTWARRLADSLGVAGAMDHRAMAELASRIGAAFPPYAPYAPSGTSHKPTGAPPKG
jgi:hypothetical protein